MIICEKCGIENPQGALYCMNCGASLVEDDCLTDFQKLEKDIKELEEENKRLKAELESKLKALKTKGKKEGTDKIKEQEKESDSEKGHEEGDSATSNEKNDKKDEENNSPKKHPFVWIIIIVLLVIVGMLYLFGIFLPNKEFAELPQYYVIGQPTCLLRTAPYNFKSEDENTIAYRAKYGEELVVVDSVSEEYYHCRIIPDKLWKIRGEQIIDGYVPYEYLLPKDEFYLLESIFKNDKARELIPLATYKRALLQYFKERHYVGDLTNKMIQKYGLSKYLLLNSRGKYQVNGDESISDNNVVLIEQGDSMTDLQIKLDNIDNPDNYLLLCFRFDKKGGSKLLYEYDKTTEVAE